MAKPTKRQWTLILICLAAGYLSSFIPSRITITKTTSVKYTVFWSLGPDADKIENGDYIRFTKSLDFQTYGCDPCSIVKRIACFAGERLKREGDSYFCQEKLLCKINGPYDKEPFDFDGRVPPKKVFVIGDNPQSYDSRYFGFIDIEDIDARLIPIF
jgi:signal peptidase I